MVDLRRQGNRGLGRGRGRGLVLCAALAWSLSWTGGGCSGGADWPPAPRNEQERTVVEAARRAVEQYDGWTDVACVVKRQGREYRVQVWKIVHPEARGKSRCVPWESRGISVDDYGAVTAYDNRP